MKSVLKKETKVVIFIKIGYFLQQKIIIKL